MNGHMRIWTFLGLCGGLAMAGAAAQAVGAGAAAGAAPEATGGAVLEKDFEMLFGAEAAKVAATPDGRDDAAFAEKVLEYREYRDRYHNSANYGICPRIPEFPVPEFLICQASRTTFLEVAWVP